MLSSTVLLRALIKISATKTWVAHSRPQAINIFFSTFRRQAIHISTFTFCRHAINVSISTFCFQAIKFGESAPDKLPLLGGEYHIVETDS